MSGQRILAFFCALATYAAWQPGSTGASRFTYDLNGSTVSDQRTGLVWQRDLQPNNMNHPLASQSYCPGLSATLGGSGWHMATVKELQTLVDYSVTQGPLIDLDAFPNTPASFFWSNNLVRGTPNFVWGVDFKTGNTYNTSWESFAYFRCVRQK